MQRISEFGLFRIARLCLLLTATLIVGCGSPSAEVTGKVTYQGQKVTSGSVVLYCQQSYVVAGLIGPDGAYRIPNVKFGSAQVSVRAHAKTPPGFQLKNRPPEVPGAPTLFGKQDGPAELVAAIPEKYNSPDKSGLELVVNQAHQVFDIELR